MEENRPCPGSWRSVRVEWLTGLSAKVIHEVIREEGPMPRAKRGNKRLEKRNKLEKLSSGYRGTKSKLYRSMKESVERGLKFAYVGRKLKKRDFRSLWIFESEPQHDSMV